MRRSVFPRRVVFFSVLIGAASLAAPALAQDISINLGGQGGGGVTERAIQLIALLTVLSIAPSILIMMTSFTRIVVVLSLLRTAMGTATAPPNTVIIALAMFLTFFVMGPVLQKSYDDGVRPLVANQITVEDALQRAAVPLRGFMQKNVRDKDLALFTDLSGEPRPATAADLSLRILVPAFMISELKRAFEIGFLLFLPYAKVLLSLGPWPDSRLFYFRRAWRILPGYYVSLFLLVMLQQPQYLAPSHWHDLALFFVLFMDSTPATFQHLNGPYWTLAIEWQFYLLLPLIALTIRRLTGRLPRPSRTRAIALCLAALMAWGVLSRMGGAWLEVHPTATW